MPKRPVLPELVPLLLQMQTGMPGRDLDYFRDTAERHNVPFDPQRLVVELRDLSAGVDGAGGFLVSAAQVKESTDILRPYSIMASLGVEIDFGLTGDTVVPRVTAKSTPQWLATEATGASPSQPTLAAQTLIPKTVSGLIQFSRRFMKQANPDPFIRRELLRSIGTAIDQAVLSGSSANFQPDGITSVFAASLGVQSVGGAGLTGASANQMLELSGIANAPDSQLSWLGTPTVRRVLQGREKSAGSGFIWSDNAMAGRPAAVTTDLPSGTLILGPWSTLYLGVWGGLVVELNPFETSNFKTGVVQARLLVSCDLAIRQPTAFIVATSVS